MSKGQSGWDDIIDAPQPEESYPVPDVFEPELYKEPAKVEGSAAERLKSGPSQATEIVRLARSRYTVVRGDDSKTYAVQHSLPGIAFGLRGDGGLRQQLAAAYYDDKGRVASGGALSDALAVLEGDALQATEARVAIRLGKHEESVVLDLGAPDAHAVVVSADGWQIVESAPILFRRTKATLALPSPSRTGTLEKLRALLNVDESGFRLIVGWLIGAMLVDSPHPILALTGQQGTAKTTAATLILSLIDPSPASMQSQPRDEENWAVSAFNAYGIGLDNISRMAPWFQDALCKAVTGAAFVRRERYSDDSISVLKFRRPIVITTIDPGALQGDVADRLLPIELQPISKRHRLTDAEVSAAADKIRAMTLGALLDLLAKVLEALPDVELKEKPRMADFAQVLAAIDQVAGWQTLRDYLTATTSAARDVVDGNSFATALVELVRSAGRWEGTCSDLLKEFGDGKHPVDWPKTPRAVAEQLSRLTPALAASGVEVYRPQERSNRGHLYKLTAIGATQCTVCGQPMHAALASSGATTHPTCDTTNEKETTS
ncbi:hypothetical protein FB562_1887 [Homoserinimonas aerilata]|uniref:ATP-binding protein n=1 Tax=Homoserinimonas aerilata TaxID=1162970 RepID=A0A542YL41_9MICO|nr:ATP-binding protein [Homoserinimonas aerilata]TQL48781.1 hypothetical protein FB562_1887 [Homoserinimonas aerilata]